MPGRRTQKTDTRRPSAIKQEFDQRVLDVARTARVTSGGRRFNFRVSVVIGDHNGRVGVGMGKGRDVSTAIDKAGRDARRNVINVPMTPDGSIPYEVFGKKTSARVFLKPAVHGRGIVAGGPTRVVLDMAGYKNLSSKIIGRSTNKANNALATIEALKSIRYTAPSPKKEVKEKELRIKSQDENLPVDNQQSKVAEEKQPAEKKTKTLMPKS